ncbi:MAG: hypothetical protein ABI781_16690 [Burkholderiales bacterium]
MATTPPPILVKTLRMSESATAAPIVDNPKFKSMTGQTAVSRRIGGKILTMSDAHEPVAGQTLMKALPPKPTIEHALPPNEQIGALADSADPGPNSVRLRLRIVNGVASVISAHVVPGVMPAPERLDYGLAYEVSIASRRVAVGTVPDVGMRRSYPDPQGRPGMGGHHLQELESIEVNLRLPQREFSAANLSKLHVQLFRMKSQPPAVPITAAPLAEQFRDQLRPAAELRGIDLKLLSPRVQEAVQSAVFRVPVKVQAPRS